jgi:hypothetical protein
MQEVIGLSSERKFTTAPSMHQSNSLWWLPQAATNWSLREIIDFHKGEEVH